MDAIEQYRDRLRRRATVSPPSPWRGPHRLHVGGLTGVGFGARDEQEYLLVISHSGRGVFALDGLRVARDPSPLDEAWHDYCGLTARGIGPLEGATISIAGLWGGGLPLCTSDDWHLERAPVDWPEERVLLSKSVTGNDDDVQIHHETLFDVRAVGFSPHGRALVIATAGEALLFSR